MRRVVVAILVMVSMLGCCGAPGAGSGDMTIEVKNATSLTVYGYVGGNMFISGPVTLQPGEFRTVTVPRTWMPDRVRFTILERSK